MSDVKFNKIRARFMARVSAPEISAKALKLAYVIAYKRMHRDTGVLFIAQDELAKEINVDERTIRTLLRILQRYGLVIDPGTGRGHASAYRITDLDDDKSGRQLPPLSQEKRTPASAFNPERRKSATAKGGNSRQIKADATTPPTKEEQPRKNNQGESGPPVRFADDDETLPGDKWVAEVGRRYAAKRRGDV